MEREGFNVGKIKLWVDGTQIEAEENQSVLNAVLSAGIYIPHLCSHPDLPPEGGCRLCMVEIDGGEPVTSCTTLARDGMKIVTKNETLDQLRRTSMELMLAGHPHDCTGCRSYGNCELQAMMQYLSVVANPGMREIHKTTTRLNTVNPLIDREMERCIACGRCVRVCEDVRGVGVLRYNRKGDEVYIGTENDLPLDASHCRFCGACVEVCPTGALQDREGTFKKDKGTRDEYLIPCSFECPAHIDVPSYLRMINAGKCDAAVAVIREKVPFPHSLGYVCTHYCEKGCKRKGLNSPLAIRDLKRYAVEHDATESWKERAYHLPPTGRKVAVVGGGPCGLTAAYYLGKKGHDVTVFERNPVAGGMLAVGIPSYRMPRADLQKEVDTIVSEGGIRIEYNHNVENIAGLKADYDAVLVAVGASEGKVIPTPNMVAEQNTTALKFLKAVALGQIDQFQPHVGEGTRVLVFGGGNVAFDAARTSARLGAQVSVVCLESREKMLADDEEIEQAQEEGVKVYSGYTNSGFNVENGRATGLNVVAVSSFRFGPNGLEVEKIPGTEEIVPCDVVIFASGQKTDLTPGFGLELNRFGFPIDPATGNNGYQTSVEGVFTAGDVITGTKAVIDAIAGGRKAAEIIDAYLGGDGRIDEHLVDVPAADPNIGRIEDFAAKERYTPHTLEVEKRRRTFDRVDGGMTGDEAKAETARCLKCPLRCKLEVPKMWTAYMK